MGELLAPAGNWESALAAFEAGADAVYAGLSRFNARERNQNFSYEDMSRLSRYTKDHGKKFYVTLNTLIKDNEIGDLTDMLESLSRLKPDALIIQDLGVLRICRRYFPDLRLHASTQMGIHNSAGLRVASEWGFSRVILERQISIEELSLMASHSPVELEIFIHGALCCSLSGMCHFSSIQGGYSGNRGKCKQPCRRFYRDANGKDVSVFSPDDLCAIPLIHLFKQWGIASYKIEGRLKRSDYVRQTVGAYRLLLDGDACDTKLQNEAYRILKGGAVRSYSCGFYMEESKRQLLGNPCVQVGEKAGEVLSVSGGKWKIRALTTLYRGDKLRLSCKDSSRIITLTSPQCGGHPVKTILPGQTFILQPENSGWQTEPGKNKMILYRVGRQIGKSRQSLERMKCFDDRKERDLQIFLTEKFFSVFVPDIPEAEIRLPWIPQPASHSVCRPEDIQKIFSHCGGSDWKAGRITVEIGGRWFVPVSQVKQWRRETERLWSEFPVKEIPVREKTEAESLSRRQKDRVSDGTVTVIGSRKAPDGSLAVRADWWNAMHRDTEEMILPFFLPEKEAAYFQKKIDEAASAGIRRFRITSLYQLAFRYPHNAVLTAAHPLAAANAFAAAHLLAAGCARIQIWPELNQRETREAYDSFGCACETFCGGKFPVLATRAVINTGRFCSQENGKIRGWTVASGDQASGITLLFPDANLKGSPISGCGQFYAEELPFLQTVAFDSLR